MMSHRAYSAAAAMMASGMRRAERRRDQSIPGDRRPLVGVKQLDVGSGQEANEPSAKVWIRDAIGGPKDVDELQQYGGAHDQRVIGIDERRRRQ